MRLLVDAVSHLDCLHVALPLHGVVLRSHHYVDLHLLEGK